METDKNLYIFNSLPPSSVKFLWTDFIMLIACLLRLPWETFFDHYLEMSPWCSRITLVMFIPHLSFWCYGSSRVAMYFLIGSSSHVVSADTSRKISLIITCFKIIQNRSHCSGWNGNITSLSTEPRGTNLGRCKQCTVQY